MDSDLNKLDILIVSALEVETQDQLNDYAVIYTGVGKVNATYELTSYFAKCELYDGDYPRLVVNYGTAGSRKFKKKTLVDCTKFIQRDMDVTGLGFMIGQTPFENDVPIALDYDHVEFNPIGKKLRCGTGDNFVQTDEDTYSDVYDMEAYALAKVCHHYDINFISFKYITDNADEHSAGDWEDNCSDGVSEFKEKIMREL